MKKKFCLMVTCILFGCISEVKIPDDVMSKNEMISFLIDVHILEAKMGQLSLSRDSAYEVFSHFESEIFEQHEVDDSLYNKSLEFYYMNPEIMEEIYEAVLDSLSLYERMSKGNLEETQSENQGN